MRTCSPPCKLDADVGGMGPWQGVVDMGTRGGQRTGGALGAQEGKGPPPTFHGTTPWGGRSRGWCHFHGCPWARLRSGTWRSRACCLGGRAVGGPEVAAPLALQAGFPSHLGAPRAAGRCGRPPKSLLPHRRTEGFGRALERELRVSPGAKRLPRRPSHIYGLVVTDTGSGILKAQT